MTGSSVLPRQLSMVTLFLLLSFMGSASVVAKLNNREEKQTERISIKLKGQGLPGVAGNHVFNANVKLNGDNFPLMVDTSGGQTWVAHSSCEKCKAKDIATLHVDLPKSCNNQDVLTYDGGYTVRGYLFEVDLKLGSMELLKFPVLFARDMDDAVIDIAHLHKYSGNLGIAGADGTLEGGPTVLKAMLDEQRTTSIEVGLYFAPDGKDGSVMEIGDPTKSSHVDPKNAVVISPGLEKDIYEIDVDYLVVNGKMVAEKFRAKLDSTFKGISYPPSATTSDDSSDSLQKELYPDLKLPEGDSSALPTVNCERTEEVKISVKGKEFTIVPGDLTWQMSVQGNSCGPNIKNHGTEDDDMWYFGIAFFHNAYPSFNFETGEIKLFGIKEQ